MRHESFDGGFLTRHETEFRYKEEVYTYDIDTAKGKCTTIDMVGEYEALRER